MSKFIKSFKKRLNFISYKKKYYLEYSKIFEDFITYKSFNLRIDLESLLLRNYNQNLQLTYLKDVIKNYNTSLKPTKNKVVIDKNYKIVSNHEKLIDAIKNNEKSVEVIIDLEAKGDAGIKINELTNDEFNIFNHIMNKTRHIYVAIVWEPAFNLLNKILGEVKKVYPVTKVIKVDFHSDQEFTKYIDEVYRINTQKNFIKQKIKRLLEGERSVYMIYYDVGDPQIDNEGTAHFQVQNLKTHIRRTFRKNIQNYIFDICYHSGINHIETFDIINALNLTLKDSKNNLTELKGINSEHWKNLR